VSPVKYELGFYISEDAILNSHRRGNFKSYNSLEIFLLSLQVDKARRYFETSESFFETKWCQKITRAYSSNPV
jgi:hypothetical protein